MLHIKKTAALTGHNAPIYALSPGRDGRHLFSAGGDGWVVEWSLDRPELGTLVAEVGQPVFSLLFLEKENLVVTGDQSGGVRFLPLGRPDEQRHIALHRRGVFDIQMVENQLFTLGGDGLLTRWELENWRPAESLRLSPKALRRALFLKKTDELVVAASDGSVYFVDRAGLFLKRKIETAHLPSVFCLLFLEKENRLLTGGRDARLKFWGIGRDPIFLEKDLPAHLFTLNDVVFWKEKIVTASRDKTLKVWDPATGELLKVVDAPRHGGHVRSVNRLLAMPGGELVSAGDDRQLIEWRLGD